MLTQRLTLLARRPLILLALAGTAFALFIAYYAPLCMYYAGRMRVNDYGIYTNFIWNSAHGEWFRYLMDFSYLQVHLSFTLLLLAPLFHLWDHPYLLAAVQSTALAGGGLLVWRLARRSGLPTAPASGLVLLFTGYALMQQVVLCDFHGVCLYFLLLPWLYHAACFERRWTWLPLLLILGLREDAGLTVVPLLCYLAARDRWPAGWGYAAAALLYTALACTVLFEWINGFTLAGMPRRGHYFDTQAAAESFHLEGLKTRALALFWLYLPALPWLLRRRTWVPVLTFPLLALLPLLLSLDPRVHGLRVQYPAIVFTGVFLGIVDALRRTGPIEGTRAVAHQAYLLLVTGLATVRFGVWYDAGSRIPYTPSSEGRHTAHVAALIPREGALLTTSSFSGFCANRRDLLVAHRNTNTAARADHLFTRGDDFNNDGFRAFLDAPDVGVRYFDFSHVILSRGADPLGKDLVRAAIDHPKRMLIFYRTLKDGGRDLYVPGGGLARAWPGGYHPGSNRVMFGRSVPLPAGRYRAFVRLSMDPRDDEATERGHIEFLFHGLTNAPARGRFGPRPDTEDFFLLPFDFDLPAPAKVEPVVYGGVARLWLDKIAFVAQPESTPAGGELPPQTP